MSRPGFALYPQPAAPAAEPPERRPSYGLLDVSCYPRAALAFFDGRAKICDGGASGAHRSLGGNTRVRDLVFLIDLDNTILDNDSVKKDIEARMLAILGRELAARFWELYELVRKDLDVIDFWEQMKRLKAEHPDNRAVDEAADALAEWD